MFAPLYPEINGGTRAGRGSGEELSAAIDCEQLSIRYDASGYKMCWADVEGGNALVLQGGGEGTLFGFEAELFVVPRVELSLS